MSTHICQHQQHPSIQNASCIKGQRNGQENRLYIMHIVTYPCASNPTRQFHTVLDLQRVRNDIQNDCEYCVIASKAGKESPLSEMTPI